MLVIRALAGLMLGLSALYSSSAFAYCRVLAESENGACAETAGAPVLHWTRSCVTYVFNERVFARLSPLTEAEVRTTFETAFQTWADVDCGDRRSPFFVEQSSKTTKTSKAVFIKDEPNESVIVARTRDEWAAMPNHDPLALAVTLVWRKAQSGEIVDFDMEINTGAGKFGDCESDCSARDSVDLANTITHEAGHVLGLGHSTISTATMAKSAVGAQTDKRTLETDDEKGYCALDLPEFECETSDCKCPEPPVYRSKPETRTAGCSVNGSHGSHAPSLLFGLALGAALLRVKARRRANTASHPALRSKRV